MGRQTVPGTKEVPVLKAVAFDMDDTLLSINLSAFIAVFAKDTTMLLADISGKGIVACAAAYSTALLNLNNNAREDDDRRSNQTFLDDEVQSRLGVPVTDPVIADVFTYYEREVLPQKNDGLIAARPRAGAHEALDAVLERGLRVMLLTNPCFSRDCIACRMGWGGLDDVPFELVTHAGNSTRCKPSPTYYLESLEKIDLKPEEVLMVGNDAKRDFPDPYCGIQTAYVGGRRVGDRATWSGTMEEFARNFGEVEERFYERASMPEA